MFKAERTPVVAYRSFNGRLYEDIKETEIADFNYEISKVISRITDEQGYFNLSIFDVRLHGNDLKEIYEVLDRYKHLL